MKGPLNRNARIESTVVKYHIIIYVSMFFHTCLINQTFKNTFFSDWEVKIQTFDINYETVCVNLSIYIFNFCVGQKLKRAKWSTSQLTDFIYILARSITLGIYIRLHGKALSCGVQFFL